MLNMHNPTDREKMKKYYRTSDMINLLDFFPNVSPIKEMVIVENEEEYLNNRDYLAHFTQNRVDSLKGRSVILGVENKGTNEEDIFLDTLRKVKSKDPLGVLVLFSINTAISERYNRYAGISIGVDVGESVYIDAVGRGFDGREVSKSICTHERYYIPWFKLRECCIENFSSFRTYLISDEEYTKTRLERIAFLESIGFDSSIVSKSIPTTYQLIPDFIWLDIIKNILKQLEKQEEVLLSYGFNHFAISGHTEGKKYTPWQMFDKSRYINTIRR